MIKKLKYFTLFFVMAMATAFWGNITVMAETAKEEIPYGEYDFTTKKETTGIFTAAEASSDFYYDISKKLHTLKYPAVPVKESYAKSIDFA